VQEIETRSFDHDGCNFALTLFRTANGFSVVAFLNARQVSPSYSVSFETYSAYFMQHQQRLTERLFEIAQSDIEQGMYFRA